MVEIGRFEEELPAPTRDEDPISDVVDEDKRLSRRATEDAFETIADEFIVAGLDILLSRLTQLPAAVGDIPCICIPFKSYGIMCIGSYEFTVNNMYTAPDSVICRNCYLIKLKVTEWFCWCYLLIVAVIRDCSTGRERCAVFWFCEGDRPRVALKRSADSL